MTIEPKFANTNDIVIKVKEFEDLVKPTSRYGTGAPYKYTPPSSEAEYREGFDKLTVKVDKENPVALGAGHEVSSDEPSRVIPAGWLPDSSEQIRLMTGINLPTGQ